MSDRENSLKAENAETASTPTDTRAAQRFMDIDWSCPWLAPLAERGERWRQAALDSYSAYLSTLNADAHNDPRVTGRGKLLSFIAQDELPAGASYEGHIAETGCVPTRYNLHDFFNGAMWFQYPRIKAALNARQAAEIDVLGIGPTRGAARDALTPSTKTRSSLPVQTRRSPLHFAPSTGARCSSNNAQPGAFDARRASSATRCWKS